MKELKPITGINGPKKNGNQDFFKQNMLIKGLAYTQDVDELKDIAQFHTRAEVYRAMDKLAWRKDYQAALAKNGLDIDAVTNKLKKHMDSDNPKISLHATEVVMKSLGLDKYDTVDQGTRPWEEVLLQLSTSEKSEPKLIDVEPSYEVITPEVPERLKAQRAQEEQVGKELYDIK